MVKTLPSSAGGAGLIPGQRAKIPHVPVPKQKQKQEKNKKQSRSNIITNSTKTLKMVHIKKTNLNRNEIQNYCM